MPLIYWTINAAKKASIFSHIFVDTDFSNQKKIKVSADVPFLRNKKYSTDFTSVNISTYQFVKRINKAYTMNIKNVFQLMPNCPFRS